MSKECWFSVFLLVTLLNKKLIRRWDIRTWHRSILLPLLRLTPLTEGFPWDHLPKILHKGQKMVEIQNIEEILPKVLTLWAGGRGSKTYKGPGWVRGPDLDGRLVVIFNRGFEHYFRSLSCTICCRLWAMCGSGAVRFATYWHQCGWILLWRNIAEMFNLLSRVHQGKNDDRRICDNRDPTRTHVRVTMRHSKYKHVIKTK